MNNCIKIKGDFNPIKFMDLFEKILFKNYDNCDIEPRSEAKFDITFTEDVEVANEEDKEEKIEEKEQIEEIEEEIEDLEIEDDNNQIKTSNNLVMEMKFYECFDGHLIRFVQKEGNRADFLDKFQEIYNLIKDIIN